VQLIWRCASTTVQFAARNSVGGGTGEVVLGATNAPASTMTERTPTLAMYRASTTEPSGPEHIKKQQKATKNSNVSSKRKQECQKQHAGTAEK
jgi:hypothetical protein